MSNNELFKWKIKEHIKISELNTKCFFAKHIDIGLFCEKVVPQFRMSVRWGAKRWTLSARNCNFRDVPFFPLSNVSVLIEHYRKTAFFHSRIKLQWHGEKPSVLSSALSQTSCVANGEGAAPTVPVEFQWEVVSHLPPSSSPSYNNSVPFSPLRNDSLNGLVSVGATM